MSPHDPTIIPIELIEKGGFCANLPVHAKSKQRESKRMPERPTNENAPGASRPAQALRLPSARASAALATIMLGIGIAVGAAIGPAPDPSFAGSAGGLAQRLPQLIAALASRPQVAAQQPAPAPAKVSSAPVISPAASTPTAASTTTTGQSPTAPIASEPNSVSKPGSETTGQSSLPPITSVWLIELAGGTLAEARAQPAAAPYITTQLPAAATFLAGWSALDASAFASEAGLAQPPAPGATPPLLHSIVQPACSEGAAGAACAPGTAGQLTAADEFLKATLAQIAGTAAYREHGLVVVTFASVAIASQQALPAGASSATLTYQPPAGAVLLSPFAHPGDSSTAYDPTSPKQSLEKLLR
jgi:hypothetical protein